MKDYVHVERFEIMSDTNVNTIINQPVEVSTQLSIDNKKSNSTITPTITQQALSNSFIQGIISGTIIAILLYPLDYRRTLIQTTTTLAENPSIWTHILGISKAIQGAQAKNLAISQKEIIAKAIPDPTHSSTFHSNQAHHDITETYKDSTVNPGIKKTAWQKGLVCAIIVAGLDTTTTTYFSNKRIHHAISITPELPTLKHKIDYGLQGVRTRYLRNIAYAGGIIVLHGMVNNYLQQQYHLPDDASTSLLSSGIVGPATGILSTPIDVIYRNQIRHMTGVKNPKESLSTPSMVDTAKNVYRNNGRFGFFRGAPNAAFAATLASAAMEGISHICKKMRG